MTTHGVAFIGLGVMGYPMAGHLARTGHQVRVFNRTGARAEAWGRRARGQLGRNSGGSGGRM